MREVLLVLAVNRLAVACPPVHVRVYSKSGTVDVISLDFTQPVPVSSHCTRVWPNDEPEFALIPSPPGCLFFGSDTPVGSDNQIPMKLPDGGKLHWIPEPEIASSLGNDMFDVSPVKCGRVLSKTVTGTRMIVVGERCEIPNYKKECDSKIRSFNATATCDIEEEATQFLEVSGWHRTLGAILHTDIKHVAFQWLPRQFFAEPDELDRKALNKSRSVSIDINIEHPSLISPPQIVQVLAFPFPAHARVNPPIRNQTHFTVQVPKAIWAVADTVDDCAVEKLRLGDLVRLPSFMNLAFMSKARLLSTKLVRGDSYARTDIPSGNPDDLQEAVLVTTVTATAGALAIIVASLRK